LDLSIACKQFKRDGRYVKRITATATFTASLVHLGFERGNNQFFVSHDLHLAPNAQVHRAGAAAMDEAEAYVCAGSGATAS
jgi:hypothetical protein